MKDKGKMRWTFRVYLQWPLYLTVFMILLTAAVGRYRLRQGSLFRLYSCLHWNRAVALHLQKKGDPGRSDCIFRKL